MKKIISLSMLFLVALAFGGCGTTKTVQPSLINPVSTTTTTSEVISNIDIKDFAFTPDVLTVKPGTTVIWTNNDVAPHRIKSATFNSAKLNPGETFSFTFNNPGTFTYICSLHTSMGGQVVVQ